MRFKVGDRVRIKDIGWYNKNKDKYGTIYTSNGFCFCDDMTKHCGEIMKIIDIIVDPKDSNQGYYIMDNVKKWTDEMIECKVEEECPQDFIEKYCKSCGTQRCDRTKEYLDGCPYYNAYRCKKQNNDMEEEMKSEDGLLDEYEELTDRAFKGGYEKCKSDIELNGFQLPEGYQFVDENGNIINTTKIVLEKKKKEYPKTYEECCGIIGFCSDTLKWNNPFCINRDTHPYIKHLDNLIESFIKLKVCRDVYWKIAGEEMGLRKPWKPDWNDGKLKWCMFYSGNCIEFDQYKSKHHTLAFPTPEMLDAFYENFKELIVQCKELL